MFIVLFHVEEYGMLPFLVTLAETNIVRRPPMTANVFLSTQRPQQAALTQMYYIAGGQEFKNEPKTLKSRSEEDVMGFNSVSLFPARK